MPEKRLDEYINSNNINIIVAAIKVAYKDYIPMEELEKIEVEEVDGVFNIKLDGATILTVDNTFKVSEVIDGISSFTGNVSESDNDQQIVNNGPRTGRQIINSTQNKICINITNAMQVAQIYSNISSELSNCQPIVDGMPNHLSERLAYYYQKLNDNTSLRITTLSSYLTALANTINTCIWMISNKNISDYNKLENYCNYLWGELDNLRTYGQNQIAINEVAYFSELTPEEYLDLMEECDGYFDEYYTRAIDIFEYEIQAQYQVFLRDTVPQVLNLIIETEYDIREANDGYKLSNYKDDCTNTILSHYGINDINSINGSSFGMTDRIWDGKSTYEKALIIMSYQNSGNVDGLINDFNYVINENNRNFTYQYNGVKYSNPLNLLKEANKLFTTPEKDTPLETAKEIVKNYQQYMRSVENVFSGWAFGSPYEYINLQSGIESRIDTLWSTSVNEGNPIDANEVWSQTLVECGFDDDILSQYDSKYIYRETFNDHFFVSVLSEKNGDQKLRKIINTYYKNLGLYEINTEGEYVLTDLGRKVEKGKLYSIEIDDLLLNQYGRQTQLNNIFTGFSSNIYNSFINNKLAIDNAKSNFKLAAAEAVDTSDITDEEVERVKNNGDGKYLDEWQLKFLAKMDKYYVDRRNVFNELSLSMPVINTDVSDFNIEISYSNYYQVIYLSGDVTNPNELKKVFKFENDNNEYNFDNLVYEKTDYGYDVYANVDGYNFKLCGLNKQTDGKYELTGIVGAGYLSLDDDKTNDGSCKAIFNNIINCKKGEEWAFNCLNLASDSLINTGNADIDNKLNDVHTLLVGAPLMASLGFGQGIYNSINGVYNFFFADGEMNVEDYRNMHIINILGENKSLYKEYMNGNQDVLYNLGTDYQIKTVVKDNKTTYELVTNNGKINLTESEYINYQNKKNKLYEILYAKGKISLDEYQRYYDLDQRKNNQKYMNTLINLNDNLGGTADDILSLNYTIGSGTGNMVIPLALSCVNPNLMSAWTFLSVSGNAREQYLRSGKDNNFKTFAQSCCIGLAAVLSERCLGSIYGYGRNSGRLLNVFQKDGALNWVMNGKVGAFLGTMLSSSVFEVGEELTENAAGYFTNYVFDGTMPTMDQMLLDTWQTTYATFLTTPFINFMGAGMRGENYFDSTQMNRVIELDVNGVKVRYTQLEAMQFYNQDGSFDNKGFLRYLLEDGSRFSDAQIAENHDMLRMMLDEEVSMGVVGNNVDQEENSIKYANLSIGGGTGSWVQVEFENTPYGVIRDMIKERLGVRIIDMGIDQNNIILAHDTQGNIYNFEYNPNLDIASQIDYIECIIDYEGNKTKNYIIEHFPQILEEAKQITNPKEARAMLQHLNCYINNDFIFETYNSELQTVALRLANILNHEMNMKSDIILGEYNGIHFKLINNDEYSNVSYQRMMNVMDAIDYLPPYLQESLVNKEIVITKDINPFDLYWNLKYSSRLGTGAAAAGGGKIHFYGDTSLCPPSSLASIFSHEIYHLIDEALAPGDMHERFSETFAWKYAMLHDNCSVSDYGDFSETEDFAEAGCVFTDYLQREGQLRVNNPFRYEILEGIEQTLSNPEELSMDEKLDIVRITGSPAIADKLLGIDNCTMQLILESMLYRTTDLSERAQIKKIMERYSNDDYSHFSQIGLFSLNSLENVESSTIYDDFMRYYYIHR